MVRSGAPDGDRRLPSPEASFVGATASGVAGSPGPRRRPAFGRLMSFWSARALRPSPTPSDRSTSGAFRPIVVARVDRRFHHGTSRYEHRVNTSLIAASRPSAHPATRSSRRHDDTGRVLTPSAGGRESASSIAPRGTIEQQRRNGAQSVDAGSPHRVARKSASTRTRAHDTKMPSLCSMRHTARRARAQTTHRIRRVGSRPSQRTHVRVVARNVHLIA